MKKHTKIIIAVILLVIAVLIFILTRDSYNYDGTAHTKQEIYDLINTAVKDGKGEIYFETSLNPGFIDFYEIMDNATQNGDYAGCELYAMRYEYTQKGNNYDVHLHLSEPSKFASFMTKIRVGWIASCFKDLNDYEKIKGVHDYLVLLNRYVAFEGGAYSTLYKGRSSCTGYAFSFYAIMRELGIDATIEIGGSHAWNRVKLDGKWYNIDVTWDDTGTDRVSYAYFLKCDADWKGHHHGGSDAKTSAPLSGKTANEYYGMVPNYILITEILLILIFLIPVVVLGIHLYKKKKKEAPITKGQVMVAGSWSFLEPIEEDERFLVIRKYSSSPEKRDIWGLKDGEFFRETFIPSENIDSKTIVTREQFLDELDFIISVCRSSNARILCDCLIRARELIESDYTYGKYSAPEQES